MSQQMTLREKSQNMKKFLESQKERIAGVLPSHLTPERMCQVMSLACGKQPKLFDCTPASLLQALMQASELGLEFSGVLGQAAIIPYGTTATFQPMYQGLVDLSYRTGRIDTIQCYIVYAGDKFDYTLGTTPTLIHKPALTARGEAIGAYCRVKLKGSTEPMIHFMSKEEIEDHRDKYSKAWNGPKKKECPWYTAPLAMWKKTVFLQLQKLLPKSAEMQKAIAYDASAETGQTLRELGMPEPYDVQAEEVPVSDPLDKIADELEGKPADDYSDLLDDAPAQTRAPGWSDQG